MGVFFFSEQPVSTEAGNNEHKHKVNKISKRQLGNRIDYEEKTNTTTNRNNMKKSASTTTKGTSNEDNEKSTETEMVKQNIFNL